jgi:hypothetical protein
VLARRLTPSSTSDLAEGSANSRTFRAPARSSTYVSERKESDVNDLRKPSRRRSVVLAAALAAVLALPAAADAKPTKQDRQNAAKECKLLRGSTDATHEAFAAKYRNLGACVSEKAREEAAERRAAKRSAVRDCRAERAEDPEAFAGKYRNFGKCVSAAVRKELKAEDRADRREIEAEKNAAKACADEREAIGEQPFKDKYGTNRNGKNAFGKCVSSHTDDGTHEDPEGEGHSDS